MVWVSSLTPAIFLNFCVTALGFGLNESRHHIEFASQDYGRMVHYVPFEVLYPNSIDDVTFIVGRLYEKGVAYGNPTRIAARGNSHSIQGQAQVYDGIVINMQTLPGPTMKFNIQANPPYVDVAGGELWINVLTESLKHGLSPVSWTDYLYLTVGGTLSNAGISGQAFRHGPQIDNVLQLEIVTGKGELKVVTDQQGSELFYGVLGGLGQFGIITKARIKLAPAPTRVKWIRALYNDFATFSKDQESLISVITKTDLFDYVEGMVEINGATSSNRVYDYYGTSYLTKDPFRASLFNSNGKTQFTLEVAKYYSANEATTIDKKVTQLLSGLQYIKTSLNIMDVTYLEFLDRLHSTELELRKLGLWEIPHPWLNLMVPKSSIDKFVQEVFGNIYTESVNGPILIYPINKLIWKDMNSLVVPNENIFYMVSILSSAPPSKAGVLERLLALNKKVLDFCQKANLGVKEYLPHYRTQNEWKAHYGREWVNFVEKKKSYDPLGLLSPGQLIFPNGTAF